MHMSLDTRFAGVNGLGALLSQHPMSWNGRLGSLFVALVCFAAAPLMVNLTAERYSNDAVINRYKH